MPVTPMRLPGKQRWRRCHLGWRRKEWSSPAIKEKDFSLRGRGPQGMPGKLVEVEI
jgi:hypothetical protein